jgi:hypothetical protein
VKIDKTSLSPSPRPRQRTQDSAEGMVGGNAHPSQQTLVEGPVKEAQGGWDLNHPLSNQSHKLFGRSHQSQSFVIFVTLLVVAFGAGILITRVFSSSSHPASVSFSPIPPTAIPPLPSPPPTATATSLDSGDELETLYIGITPADIGKITAKREEALRLGILLASNADYVPATIRVGHDEIPVELRLKGDWIDHIAHNKWSFRVRTLDENYVFGMHVFSLQDPSTRSFLDEWLLLENLRREDVLAPRYFFVRVVLNGEYKGIYALEEGFSRELLEAQQRREGPIIRYDEDLVWEYRAFYDDQVIPRGVNEFYIIDEFQSGRTESDPTLAAQRDVAVGMLRALWTGERTAGEVFDLDAMGDFLALTDLWSAPHGLIWHNLRYYYNPITTRLEPIAFDSDALAGEQDMVGLPESAFYHDPALQAAYVRSLWRISQTGYIENLEKQLGAQYEALRGVLEPEFGADVLTPPWDLLRRRQELLRQTLHPYQTVYAYRQQSSPESLTLIDVGNLLELPLEIVAIDINGTLIPAERDWVGPESAELLVPLDAGDPGDVVLLPLAPDATYMNYVHLQIPSSTLLAEGAGDMTIVTRLWGLTEQHADKVLPGYPTPLAQGPLPELPTVSEVLAQHPYLEPVRDEKMLYVDAGTWDVNGNLILPRSYGLRLSPGTTLRFGRDNYLLASGPLDFRGTADAPIVLEPIAASDLVSSQGSVEGTQPDAGEWSGVVVLGAASPSIWNYVTVERTSAIDQEGWVLTGGVTFYESPIRMANSRILDSQGEDGINVIRTEFEFLHSEFSGSASDAFDADFGQGTIRDSSFHDIVGDAIDLSGSDVRIERVKLLNVADKGVSVGEASQLDAYDVRMENVGLGIVSKDLSKATIKEAAIANARVAGLAAYIKKPAYGPATLIASSVQFVEMPPERYTLVQTGSWLELEGRRIEGTDVDVDALYQ